MFFYLYKKILLGFAIFFLFCEQAFTQGAGVSRPCPGVLINGVCWAEYNVDEPGRFAAPDKPNGMLYQWNRKKGWPAMMPDTVSGWDSSLEPGDTWEPANDPCPAGWRMPTVEEIKMLLDDSKVTQTRWIGWNKAFGTKYTDIATGNTVLFPAAGCRQKAGNEAFTFVDEYYWSSTEHWTLYRGYNSLRQQFNAEGYSVRCVADENACDIVLTASETICKEALPYTWHDTTFREGTVTGEYRFRRTNPTNGCDSILYLYLTVDTLCGRPCKERGTLINGVCWAESNVDTPNTFADTPESFGLLYKWNGKKGFPVKGIIDGYDWYDGSDPKSLYWKPINNPCPPDWRIPTIEELCTLLDDLNVTREWTQQNGVNGMRFTDRLNGNTVFFPGAGSRSIVVETPFTNTAGHYWSITSSDIESAYGLLLLESRSVPMNLNRLAFSVRCVVGRDTTGCDNIVTDTSVIVCANDLPYEWGDTTFGIGTESGIYRFQRISAVTGCDSIVNLRLTVDKCEKPCLGVLINGVCWAEYNVDEPGRFATPDKPYGMLYQWNRKKGWPAMTPDTVHGWDSSIELGDTWEAANDPCPAGWRMPTVEEIKTLLDKTKVTSTEKVGWNKAFGTRYTDIATGNMVFFPIAGCRQDPGNVAFAFMHEYYWSSTEHWTLYRGYSSPKQQFNAEGYSVRCVADENACDIVLTISENICKEALPYTWHDTTFLTGTTTGEYRLRRTNPISKCDTIFYLYLTVDTLCGRPCKERGTLINGVCWAESNVDTPNTFAETPESFGLLYRWNWKKGLPLKGNIDWEDWGRDSKSLYWEPINNPCPPDWRIPTIGELHSLLDDLKVTREWMQQNGVNGLRFTDRLNGNTFFLPAAEHRDYSFDVSGEIDNGGHYWSTTRIGAFTHTFTFFSQESIFLYGAGGSGALSVRCVAGRDTTGCDNIVTDTSVIVCANDLPYEWCDTTFGIGTESGIYRFQRISTVTGCDSIVNLHLTIQQPFDTTLYDTVCRGASYNRYGFSLSDVQADDIYTLPLFSLAGCDSTLTLHLKVRPVYDTTLYDTVCQGDAYNNYGFSFTAVPESLTRTLSLHTIHGCDSNVTLNLHVWPTYFNSQTKDICSGDTIDFRGRKLYKTGVYYDSLTTVHGCDSVYCMTLNVHPVYNFSFSGSACSGHPYSNYGFSLPAVYRDTIVRDTFKTRWGCDSLRTLSLTVHPVYDTILYDTICQGDAYNNYGFSFTAVPESLTRTLSLHTIHGCDSIVTLNLHVWPKYLYAYAKDICDGDTVDFRGRKLYESGVYYDSLKTVHGCDSVYRMTLTVHSTAPSYIPDAVCSGSGYHKYGFHLPAVYRDTVFRDTFVSVWGCDSIRILSLSVRPVYDTPLYDTVCQGDDYRIHGFSLSSVQGDGLHTLRLFSRDGCDSVLTLHLKVHPVYDTVLYDSVCPSARYARYGFHLSDVRESGTYRRLLHTVHGCDSVVTLELYVYPTYFYPRRENICEGDTFGFRGRRLYESGTYYDSLTTVHGCDSVYCLYLTVHPVYDVRFSGILCEGTAYSRYGFNVTTPGEHYRYLKTVAGCDSTVFLTLMEEKKIAGSISVSLEDCSLHGYSFFFDPVVPQSAWLWDMGDGTVFRTEEGYHTYADSGLYRIQLRLETSGGCENQYSYVQYVPPYLPEIPIRANRLLIDEDYPTVRFRVDVLRGMRCEWDFGDGATGVGDSVSHTYDARSEKYYDVLLKVFNADSCVTESRAQIEVAFFPKALNTFSPNGDGLNDVFMGDYRIEIINRNGLRIYTGENGWDGTYNGSPAPADTYFYRLYYRTALGERMKTGYVTLIR